jgi:hypothetical protein
VKREEEEKEGKEKKRKGPQNTSRETQEKPTVSTPAMQPVSISI